jgi:DNA-binding helix-hairpin-helix protein with protein kinase domain
MDPFTLLAGAQAIYNGIKSATDAGHEAIDVVERVGSLFARIAQITQLTSGNRKKKLFQSQAEYEAEAIKLYALRAKAQQLQLDTKNLFVGAYGQQAWTAIQKEVTEMRKEAVRQAAIAQKEAEERQAELILGAWMFLGVIVMALGLALFVYLTAHK